MNNHDLILPSNATELERSLEKTAAQGLNLSVGFRGLWNIETVPAVLLPFLAWELSVDDYPPDASEAQKRQIIKNAFSVHKYKGTLKSVKDAIAPFNLTYSLKEWFESGGSGVPGTFILTLLADASYEENGVIISENLLNRFVRTVENVKPLRCHATYRVGARFLRELKISFSANIILFSKTTAEVSNPTVVNKKAAFSMLFQTISIIQITAEAI
jgi:phage tail P2-like protein